MCVLCTQSKKDHNCALAGALGTQVLSGGRIILILYEAKHTS